MLLIGYNSKLSYLCLHFQCESAIDFFKTSKIGDRWCKLIKKLIRAVNKSILNSNSKWGLDLSKIIEHINTIKQSSNITFLCNLNAIDFLTGYPRYGEKNINTKDIWWLGAWEFHSFGHRQFLRTRDSRHTRWLLFRSTTSWLLVVP